MNRKSGSSSTPRLLGVEAQVGPRVPNPDRGADARVAQTAPTFAAGRVSAGHRAGPGALAALVERLQRRADDAEREGATAPVANIYRVVIEELQPLLNGAAVHPVETSAATRLLTADEVAERLHCSRKWVYRHRDRLPFARRVGRAVRFDSTGLETWLARLR